MSLHVSAILNRKGSDVVTIDADATFQAAIDKLAEHNIGALVVSSDGRTPEGILSERDLVRQLARYRTDARKRSVRDIMVTDVRTCTLETTLDELMAVMTEQRIRHIPVMSEGALCGIVSIGDVVKSRLDELEVRSKSLEQYVTGTP